MWTTPRFPASWLLPALLPVALMTLYPSATRCGPACIRCCYSFPTTVCRARQLRPRGHQRYFLDALYNSLVFTVIAAPLVVVLGTLTALFLQQRFLGSRIVRSIVLLPWVLPGAISAVLWIWVFHPSFGVLNGALRALRLIDGSIPWLISPKLALISVVVAHVWTQIPFAVVLIMAAFSAINSETLEAAAIDCRSAGRRFRHMSFPRSSR